MDGLMDVVQSILGAGPSVMLPIIIFIVGIIFRVPVKKAIISGITVGIGMIGINLVITVLTTNVGPAAQAMVERFGLNLTIIDAGWPAVSAGTWAQPIAAVMIPVILIVNLIMLALNRTKTLNIDIWNYWHVSSVAATGYIVTKSFLWHPVWDFVYDYYPNHRRQNSTKSSRILWLRRDQYHYWFRSRVRDLSVASWLARG